MTVASCLSALMGLTAAEAGIVQVKTLARRDTKVIETASDIVLALPLQ